MSKRILIVGAGFSGAVLARELAEHGEKSVVVDRNAHVGGHCHTERDFETGVMVHKFGPRIFNTDDTEVWAWVQRFGEFRPFVNRVKAINRHGVFSFPINLHTINQFFGKQLSPEGAQTLVQARRENIPEPANFEEKALSLVGRELYEAFFKHYTHKQWGRDPKLIPASVASRLPLRFDYNDSYYNTRVVAIPAEGYSKVVESILEHPLIELKSAYLSGGDCQPSNEFQHVFYTGPIDEFFDYKLGRLSYRTLEFRRESGTGDLQGNAVINYTDDLASWTRVTEHKHFAPWETHERSVMFYEYSRETCPDDVPFYPVRTPADLTVLNFYQERARRFPGVTFLGRLGRYEYLDMDDVIRDALDTARNYLQGKIGGGEP